MCGCSDNTLNLETLKIYTFMGSYKAKYKAGISVKGNFKIAWATATQEELAYAYEELGMIRVIDKTSTTKTKDESKKATEQKKSSKNSKDSKE
tara:strand:+ start:2755 stop:3033 length:279 start_codon:yes stop_codon:yes gene_type:complete